MKKLFTLIMVIFLTLNSFAQSPEKMSYQCVVRNVSGVLVTNQAVGIKISILQGSASGTVVFSETYSPNPQTNANGLVTVEIGGGTPVSGIFSNINWASGPYFLRTETDPTGGTSYTIVGTSQLLSVPYALHSKTAATADYNSLTNLPTLNITNWNTAFGWGNHVGLYRPISYVPTWTDVTGKPTFATVATSGSYNDLSNKPTILNSQWTTSGSNIYYSLGNVGIGTSTPSSKLEVRGVTKSITVNGATATSGQFQAWTEGGAAGQRAVYSFYPTFEATPGDNVPRRAADIVGGFNGGNWGFEYLTFNVGSSGATNDAQNLTSEKMRITSNGNVGIGIANPGAYKLNVNGGSVLIGDGTGLNGTLKFTGHTYIGSADWGNLTLSAGTKSGDAVMALVTENQTRLFISGNGNVGIGTTTPTTKLDVNGVINVNSNKITNVATPTNGTDAANKAYVDSNSGKHFKGESYGGGIVCYLYDNGQHGLIVATEDQSTGIQWYNGTDRYTGASGDGFGAGEMNTAMIVALQINDNNTGNFAAKVCADYSVYVSPVMYGDWYLPSKSELQSMFDLHYWFGLGGFATTYYWSSTETWKDKAWNLYFYSGIYQNDVKTYPNSVRCVRRF